MNSIAARICFALSALLAALPSIAQDYPNRPVKLLVGYAPGGLGDVLARLVADKLTARLGQPVVVENRLGAGATIAAGFVAKAPADGYTLLMGAAAETTFAVSTFGPKLPYDPARDLAPISMLNVAALVLITNPSLGFSTVKELIDYGKANPGKLNYASFGNGSSSHLAAEMFRSATGLNVVHVPFRGSAPAMQEVLAGRIPFMFDTVANSIAQIRAGKLTALAVTSPQRTTSLPQVPTFKEIGMSGIELMPWAGLFAPAGTPATIIQRLNRDVRDALGQPDIRDRLRSLSADAAPSTPEELGAHVKAEIARVARIVNEAKLKFE